MSCIRCLRWEKRGHEHFFDFESCDREWHKLKQTWDERVEGRKTRENHEKEVYLTKCDHIKPNKDNMNVSSS